jgi:MFS family permease
MFKVQGPHAPTFNFERGTLNRAPVSLGGRLTTPQPCRKDEACLSNRKSAVIEQEAAPAQEWLKDFLLTWICRLSIFLSHHVTRPVLPLYLITFGASSTIIGAVMAVFTITATATRIPVGMLIDRIGRKPFLLGGIAIFGAGNFGYLWAPSILSMLPFRVLHGAGWSGCTTAVATLAADIVPPRRRGDLMGYAGMASSLASALGPVIGFALLQRSGYLGVFLGAGALLGLGFLAGLPVAEVKPAPESAPATAHWLDTIVVKETLQPAVAVAFLSFGHGGVLTFLPIHALTIGMTNPGVWFAIYAGCVVAIRPIAGPVSDRVSRRAVIIPGLLLNFAGLLLLALGSTPLSLMAAAAVAGLGTGAAQPALTTVAVDQATAQRRGQSLAQFQFFYDLGIGIGSLVLGALLDLAKQDFTIMYSATALVALLGLWIYWRHG